jgi:hypothetical protein
LEQQSKRHLTIGEWMALIAALALGLSLPHALTARDATLTVWLAASVPILYGLNIVVDALVGLPCPGCGRWTLRRLTRARSYACCSCCGRRFKRLGFGSEWRDASSLDDDAVFRRKSRRWSWIGYTIPGDDDESTTGALLRNRRKRRDSAAK